MGVYIKGMTLKQLAMNNCDDCPIEYFCKYGHSIDRYSMNGGRPTSCPLVEIQEPHGRLIDIDKALDVIADEWGYEGTEDDIEYKVPTVIEAEGE